jgi:hypothetical protein
MRHHLARFLCHIGQWLVMKGIEVAGTGRAEVEFEVDDFAPLPLWLKIIGTTLLTIAYVFFLIVFFAATGVK